MVKRRKKRKRKEGGKEKGERKETGKLKFVSLFMNMKQGKWKVVECIILKPRESLCFIYIPL